MSALEPRDLAKCFLAIGEASSACAVALLDNDEAAFARRLATLQIFTTELQFLLGPKVDA